jgi:hypothetical protein
MLVPGFALGRRVMDHAQLAYRVDGMGIELPCKPSYAERAGSSFHGRRQFRVSSIVGRTRCQRSGGKEMWQEAREAIR